MRFHTGNVDRKKHDVDVIERVLSSAHEPAEAPSYHTHVVNVGLHPWVGGSARSTVELTVGVLLHDRPGSRNYDNREDRSPTDANTEYRRR